MKPLTKKDKSQLISSGILYREDDVLSALALTKQKIEFRKQLLLDNKTELEKYDKPPLNKVVKDEKRFIEGLKVGGEQGMDIALKILDECFQIGDK